MPCLRLDFLQITLPAKVWVQNGFIGRWSEEERQEWRGEVIWKQEDHRLSPGKRSPCQCGLWETSPHLPQWRSWGIGTSYHLSSTGPVTSCVTSWGCVLGAIIAFYQMDSDYLQSHKKSLVCSRADLEISKWVRHHLTSEMHDAVSALGSEKEICLCPDTSFHLPWSSRAEGDDSE